MKTLKLAFIASACLVAACQKNDTANDMAANDAALGDENIAIDNGAAMNTTAGSVDTAFVTEAIKGDNSEVAIGNLAADKATSQAAKDFGKMLATDHGAHKDKLLALASTAGVTPTDEPSPEGKANLDKLKGLSGAAFDKEFKRMMVEDHTKDIAKYEKQASSGDAQTAALAKETLPTLRKHLDTANSL
jgi:putative membrane protein